MRFMTCSSQARVVRYTDIPQGVHLSAKVDLKGFREYVNNIFAHPDTYQIFSGWIEQNKTHTTFIDYLIRNAVVASQSYSNNCKVFIFPISSLQNSWLKEMAIYTTTPNIDLIYFLIYKRRSNAPEKPISCEIVDIEDSKAYRIVESNNQLYFRETTIDRLLVTGQSNPRNNRVVGQRGRTAAASKRTKRKTCRRRRRKPTGKKTS